MGRRRSRPLKRNPYLRWQRIVRKWLPLMIAPYFKVNIEPWLKDLANWEAILDAI